MKNEKSFGIIVTCKTEDQWHFLLVYSGHWGFPKGHPDPEEIPFETAQRETFEETGIVIESVYPEITFTESYKLPNNQGGNRIKIVQYFLSILKIKLPAQAQNEIRELGWFSYTEAMKKITYTESREVLLQVHNWLSQNLS